MSMRLEIHDTGNVSLTVSRLEQIMLALISVDSSDWNENENVIPLHADAMPNRTVY